MNFFHRLYEDWIEEGDQTPMPIRGTLNIMSHWVFQGTYRMDTYERTFKLLCSVVFVTICYLVTGRALLSIFVGHTINLLINSHIIAAFRAFNLSAYRDWKKFQATASYLLNSASSSDWMDTIYVTGSVNRDEWEPGSDLDVIFIRKPGFKNGFFAVFGTMATRLRATVRIFPLDVYVFDSHQTLEDRMINDDEDLIPYEELDSLDEKFSRK